MLSRVTRCVWEAYDKVERPDASRWESVGTVSSKVFPGLPAEKEFGGGAHHLRLHIGSKVSWEFTVSTPSIESVSSRPAPG
jgi:hypothetical protein